MKTKVLLASIVLLGFLFNSCKKENGMGVTTDMVVSLTDSPGNYDEVNVDVQSVEIITEAEGTKTLNTKTGIYNLLNYTGGEDTVIATGKVRIGPISQIRLILGDNNTVVVNGVSHHLLTPSGEESGLKLQLHDSLVAGVQYALLLDFDANQSIVQQGNGDYLLKPVIRVVSTALTGSIQGMISPSNLHATITAEANSVSYSTNTRSDGTFLLKGIPAGTYTVTITPDLPNLPVTIDNVTVTTGASTNLNTITF